MKAHSKRVNGNNPDEEIYHPALKSQAEIKTHDQLKETQPLTQAERARTEIKDIPDSEERKKAVHFLIDMLLHEEEFRDVVLEAVDPYFRNRVDEERLKGVTPEMANEEFRDVVLETVEPYFRDRVDEEGGMVKEVFEQRSEKSDLHIDPNDVDRAFKSLIEGYQSVKPGQRGRRPRKAERIYQVVKGRENEAIPIDDFAKLYEHISKNPRKHAASDLSWINKAFEAIGEQYEFKGISRGHDQDRTTSYQLRRRSLKKH